MSEAVEEPPREEAGASLRHVEPVMGTVVSIDVRRIKDRREARRAVRQVVSWLHRVDRIFSTYRPGSSLLRLQQEELVLDQCPPEMTKVLALAETCQERTGGAFDLGWREDGRVDPTGVVKGWAAQRASWVLSEAGFATHSINAAGDVILRGNPRPGLGWTTGIAHPHVKRTMVAAAVATDIAIATSGTVEQATHIVDPRIGLPSLAVASATVLGPDLGEADGYATAAVSLGRDAGCLLERLDGEGWPSLVVYTDGRIWSSVSFPGQVFPAGIEVAGDDTRRETQPAGAQEPACIFSSQMSH